MKFSLDCLGYIDYESVFALIGNIIKLTAIYQYKISYILIWHLLTESEWSIYVYQ